MVSEKEINFNCLLVNLTVSLLRGWVLVTLRRRRHTWLSWWRHHTWLSWWWHHTWLSWWWHHRLPWWWHHAWLSWWWHHYRHRLTWNHSWWAWCHHHWLRWWHHLLRRRLVRLDNWLDLLNFRNFNSGLSLSFFFFLAEIWWFLIASLHAAKNAKTNENTWHTATQDLPNYAKCGRCSYFCPTRLTNNSIIT